MSDCEDYGDGSDDGYDSEDACMSQGAGTQDTDDSDPDEGDADYGNAILSGVEAHVVKREEYRCLDAEQVLERQREAVRGVTQVLQVTQDDATQLLRAFKWNVNRVNDEWFGDEEGIREKVGLESSSSAPDEASGMVDDGAEVTCSVCYDEFPASKHTHVGCGHNFCATCWSGYLENAVSDGPSVLDLRCPQEGCKRRVPEPMAKRYLKGESAERLDVFKWRSWVDDNPRVKWCTGAGCEVAVLCHGDRGEGPVDVHCGCGASFCWSCQEDAHRPVDCETVKKWLVKNSAESENMNWILANTKSCPKCSTRIEKNQGCNHMTCQSCRYEFCWICMGNWTDHGANTGGYYRCNKFDPSDDPANMSDAAKAKRELDRYLHYYKRYHAHSEAEKFAKRQLKETAARMIILQEQSDSGLWADVEFLKTANQQLVECRRVLKYTYAFAYYMPLDMDDADNKAKKERFEYHQEMLERFTENLSELCEKPLAEMDRTDVVNQTRVVKNFLENVLRYVDEGLED